MLQSPWFGFFFGNGFYLILALKPVDWRILFFFRLGSQFNLSILQNNNPTIVGINVFALAISLLLFRAGRKALRDAEPQGT